MLNNSDRDRLRQILTDPYAGVAADDEALRQLITRLGYQLPEDYLGFLRESDGYTGSVGVDGFVSIWPTSEVVPFNEANRFREWIPGFVLFGSNEGGEFYAFDLRNNEPKVVSIPSIPLDASYAIEVGRSFVGFLENLAKATR